MALFLIGAGSYLVFRRMTRAEYVIAESERWLAERRQTSRWIKRRKKRWALRVPASVIILICTSLDYTWALASHLLHPRSGRLIEYEVPIPLMWSIAYTNVRRSITDADSIVVAARYRGLIKAGSGLYIGRRPFSASNMNFRSIPAGDVLATGSVTKIISVRTLPFGTRAIQCMEEIPPHWMTSGRYIHCSTPTGNLSANFQGADEDVAAFYDVLSSVKPLT